MSEEFCSRKQLMTIADSLNAGDATGAIKDINGCTVALIYGSDYRKVMSEDREKIYQGEPEATARAHSAMAKLAGDERSLWQTMSDAAREKNPAGLCQLQIVDDKYGAPHVELQGSKCH